MQSTIALVTGAGKSKPAAATQTTSPSRAVTVRPTAASSHDTIIIQHMNLADHSTQIGCTVDIDKPLFQPTPNFIEFKGFSDFVPVEAVLTLRNQDKFARRIKVEPIDSPFFKLGVPTNIRGKPTTDSRIAPGMEVCYKITFTPRERNRDYNYDVVCVTEREKFIVPLRASGAKAALSLPSDFTFGSVAVKNSTMKTIVLRNLSDQRTEFYASTEAPYSVSPLQGFIDGGATAQLTLTFTPPEPRTYDLPLTVTYGVGAGSGAGASASSDYVVVTALSGTGDSSNIHLDTSLAVLDATYITLSTQTKVVLHNDSDGPVRFTWRQFLDVSKEGAHRAELNTELDKMYDLERAALEEMDWSTPGPGGKAGKRGGDDNNEKDDSDDSDDGLGGIPLALRAELAALDRKFKNLKRQVAEDPLWFQDPAFVVTPMEGLAWAHSDMEFTITFTPDVAANYACCAYLEVTGRELRLPLQLRGVGIGPKAVFSSDIVDIGDVFVTSTHSYELVLTNKGDILAEYKFKVPKTPFASKFKFVPDNGSLALGQSQRIAITFCSDILGEFAQTFDVAMKGSNENLRVLFKGHVMAPTFHLDVDEVDFGTVAFGFLNSRNFSLFNTSTVPFAYRFRVPQDGELTKQEFSFSPVTGTVEPGAQVDAQLDFISSTVGVYDACVVVDVLNVGDSLKTVPIRAQCVVPEVTLSINKVNFGECFVRFPYIQWVTIDNSSDHSAKYEVLPQDEHSAIIAEYKTDAPTGDVPAKSTRSVPIQLICDRLGNVHLPLLIRILGTTQPPMQATLEAVAIGPRVVPAVPEVNWGRIDCLKDFTQPLVLTNKSSIPAQFKTFIKSPRSKFRMDILEGTLQPEEVITITLTANLDDTLPHSDELHIVVTEGENSVVILKARGSGTTMSCGEDISVLDFGHVFTSNTCERTFLLENKGRRVQSLQWVNASLKEREAEERRKAKSKKSSPKKTGGLTSGAPEAITPVFTVEPDVSTLKPRTACLFTVRGVTTKVGAVLEQLQCFAKVGSEKAPKVVFSCDAKADFILPLLQPSVKSLKFVYMHDSRVPTEVQSQQLTLTNIAKLPLTFTLRTTAPFSVDGAETTLAPNESKTYSVEFDPAYKHDKVGHVAEGKVTIVYASHPRRDTVDLIGDINYPNIVLEYAKVEFGCILNDTTKSVVAKVQNPSKIPCVLSWSFVEKSDPKKRPAIPINQVFDILPIRSVLRPGDSDVVEFLYYGHANRKFSAVAVCEVEGGPEYDVALTGEAATLGYRLDRASLDFGEVQYDSSDEKEFFIHNTAKVPYSFLLRTELLSRPGVVQVSPSSGRINAGDKQRILVRMKPGIPDHILEKLVVEVAHFDPIEFPILCRGVYASAAATLPRDCPSDWAEVLDTAKENLVSRALADAAAASSAAHTAVFSSAIASAQGVGLSDSTAGRAAGGLAAPTPTFTPLEIEAEACRILFLRAVIANTPKFNIAQFVCDFGNVVSGAARKKTFKLTNNSTVPLTLEMDKTAALASGFTVEPTRVQRIAPSESVEMAVTFKATKRRALGLSSLDLSLTVRNGPPILLCCRANVTIPDIRITPDTVDFGDVLLEQSKVIALQFHNVAPVVTEWEQVTIVGLQVQYKDKSFFSLQPSSGVLQPGERQLVKVVFTPSEARNFSIKLPLKVGGNPKNKQLVCRGRGAQLGLQFDPPRATLGPVLPKAPPAATTVMLVNPTNTDIEVYSLDFDPVYKEEEAVVKRVGVFDADGYMRVEPRLPGSGLPAAIVSALNAQSAESKEDDGEGVGELERPSESLADDTSARGQGTAANIMITGPPGSGKSTLVSRLLSTWSQEAGASGGVTSITIDNAIAWAQSGSGGPALAQRVQDSLYPPKSAEELAAEEAAAKAKAAAAAAAAKKPVKGKPVVEEPVVVAPPPPPRISTAVLAEVLYERSRRADCSRAIILDDLTSVYVESAADAALAVSAAWDGALKPGAGVLQVFALNLSGEALTTRYNATLSAADATEAALKEEESGPDADAGADERAKRAATSQAVRARAQELLSGSASAASFSLQSIVKCFVSVPRGDGGAAGGAGGDEEPDVDSAANEVVFDVDADDEPSAVFAAVCMNLIDLPSVSKPEASGELVLPPPVTLQLLRRPMDRPTRRAVPNFNIVRALTDEERAAKEAKAAEAAAARLAKEAEAAREREAKEKEAAKGAKGGKGGKPGAAAAAPPPEPAPVVVEPEVEEPQSYRWIIPARSSVPISVEFSSSTVGSSGALLGFGIVGSSTEYSLNCSGLCAVPSIATDSRSVFMSRVKGGDGAMVSRKWVQATKSFQFGPLLIGKPATTRTPAVAGTNATVLRISNNGVFEASVELAWAGGDAAAVDGSPAADGTTIFSIEPKRLDAIPPGEMREVQVWAFPGEVRSYFNTLVACVKDNPTPVQFAFSAVGASPVLALRGPWETAGEKKEEEVAPTPAAAAGKGAKPGGKPAAVKGAAPSARALPSNIIDFDRILIGRTEESSFTIENTCTVPVAWRFPPGAVSASPEFRLSPSEGVLAPGTTTTVSVSFGSPTDVEREVITAIEYADVETGLAAATERAQLKSIGIMFKGEVFRTLHFAKFDEGAAGAFDFGSLRCGQKSSKKFTLQNKGKYGINYNVSVNARVSADAVTCDTTTGQLAPGAEKVVTVTFLGTKETVLKDAKCVQVQILEGRSGEVTEKFPVSITGRSVFTNARVTPARGINFGALRYSESRERQMEVRNEGEFPLTWQLVQWGSDPDLALQSDNAKMANGQIDPTAAVKAAPAGPLTLGSGGCFKLTPQGGTLAAGQTATVNVSFAAVGAATYRDTVRVHIANCDPKQDLDLQRFDLIGESCNPGVNAKDWEDVFEEQAIVSELLEAEGAAKAGRGRAFALKERVFTFGHVVPSSNPKGICEKFKITNPFKVKAVVALDVTPQSAADKDAFTVQPASVEIPPHEHRYVDVYFKPLAMKRYAATFVANVEGGTDPASNQLKFGLTGDGVLPHVTVVEPSGRNPSDGSLLLDLGRMQAGRSVSRNIVLRNDGVVPATVKFEMSSPSLTKYGGEEPFPCDARGTSVTLQPGDVKEIPVGFAPSARAVAQLRQELDSRPATGRVGAPAPAAAAAKGKGAKGAAPVSSEPAAPAADFESVIVLSVLYNQFETNTVKLIGRSFTDDLAFDNLPGHAQDEIVFGDVDVSDEAGQQVPVTLVNQSDEVLRYSFPAQKDFSMDPSVGHILPRSSKDVVVTFLSSSPVSYSGHVVAVGFQRIRLDAPGSGGWDCKAEGADGLLPEPKFTTVGELKSTPLKLTATAENVTYKCEETKIVFKPTMLFQSRVHKVVVTNPTKARLEYNWSVDDLAPVPPPTGGDLTSRTSKAGGPATPPSFTIEPATGTILPNSSTTFTVRFTPQDVHDFRYSAAANIRLLSPSTPPLVLSLSGRSQRPLCHIDLPHSDYLDRRPAGKVAGDGSPLDPSTRVVEFKSLGLRVKNTFRFGVVNPTNTSYEFTWEPVGVADPAFRCVTNSGVILGGKRLEMVFEFTPVLTDPVESLYRFSIPSQSISTLFLVAGSVTEPKVLLDHPHVNFKEILCPSKSTETIYVVNLEHIPFAFAFDVSGVPDAESSGRKLLVVDPVEGVVPPNGKTAVELTFSPSEEKTYNLNVPCIIKKKPTPLSLNVKGEGYAVHDSVTLDHASDGVSASAVPLSADGLNYVQFGHVHVNERAVKNVVISNTGKVNFDFSWVFDAPAAGPVTVTPQFGRVATNTSVTCQLEFKPTASVTVEGLKLKCDVAGTRSYRLAVSGTGSRPAVAFSASDMDFGPCFFPLNPGVTPVAEVKTLRVTNNEREDVSLECLFTKKPHLEVGFDAKVLRPNESVDVPISFLPRAAGSYSETVLFEVNGLYSVPVAISGEGTPIRLVLSNPTQENVAFGSLRVGQDAIRRVSIVNRSKRAASFALEDVVKDPTTGRGALETQFVTFSPREATLRPKESVVIDIRFAPPQRVQPFSESIMLSVAGDSSKLLSVTGGCQGMEVKLDNDNITFGPVCIGSRMSKTVTLLSVGDIGTKYEWAADGFGSDLSITPTHGFVAPHSEARFELVFHPTRVARDLRFDSLRCRVDGLGDIRMFVSGECVPQPESDVQTVPFECRVREEVTKKVPLVKNDTTAPWTLTPVVNNDMWKPLAPTVVVPPGAVGECTLVYKPLIMTKPSAAAPAPAAAAGKKGAPAPAPAVVTAPPATAAEDPFRRPVNHEGSLFFALPNGRALLYKLVGVATAPALAGTVTQTTPAKANLAFTLPVTNWLKSTQRFSVSWDDLPPSTTLRGAKSVDVPSLGTRDYKLVFYAYKQLKPSTVVKFTNDSTGEYMHFNVDITVTPPGKVDTIPLEAVVRQTATYTLTLENPLPDETIVFAPPKFTHKCVRVSQLGDMTGKSEGSFKIEYRPLVPTAASGGAGGVDSEEVDLTLHSDQLGDYHYTLKLKATPAGPEPPLRFQTDLGGQHKQSVRFRHFLPTAASYTVSVTNPECVQVPATVSAPAPTASALVSVWDGVEVSLDVAFEPEVIGQTKAELRLTSAEGGVYVWPIIGVCEAAKPRGPFPIPKAGSVNIDIKNVLREDRDFTLTTDNPAFTLASPTVRIQAKKTSGVVVKFNPVEGSSSAGKLIVSCPSVPDLPPWVYYLNGV